MNSTIFYIPRALRVLIYRRYKNYFGKCHGIISGLKYLFKNSFNYDLNSFIQTADRFGVERLKKLCENFMLSSINIENAAHILYSADMFDAKSLRERCISYIITYFNDISKTKAFEEVGRCNINLGN